MLLLEVVLEVAVMAEWPSVKLEKKSLHSSCLSIEMHCVVVVAKLA